MSRAMEIVRRLVEWDALNGHCIDVRTPGAR